MKFGIRRKTPESRVGATDTYIGGGTVIEGKIVSAASLRIDGTVAGDIECAGDVTVGASGVVKSNIAARSVYNAGTIEGSIAARGKIAVSSKGRVLGNMSAASLHISEGAFFRGECAMERPARAEEVRAPLLPQPPAGAEPDSGPLAKRKDGKAKQPASA